ncbi:striated muscle preferentially expressed protein kinase-like [Dendronephthya gigantea]|uniref:striated muscle preferentially expressed protein kinase-like n=1 Tax=Dendronephthya gigantea TaxID=151771 RepID=UPI00106A0F84|nr:striated muscle preferentially expressed protein kinase-like [Dendronephthya gigantea]
MHGTENFKENIHEDYDIEDELGRGQFAVVRKIVEKDTGDEFAAKYVRKKRTAASRNGMTRNDIIREIEILRMVDNEKIIKVHDVYETDREIILIMELLRGGELFDYISKKDYLTEEEAIDFTRQILQGLQHLHSRKVVHLDLKPENILLKNTRRKTIKLVDFGLARVVNENEPVREIMGTPEFVAPEVLNYDAISTATDMWALGVIAYILLSGASPFLGECTQETFTNIIQVDYQFDEEYFSEISDEAKDFIRKLLVKNPRKRMTAHDCSRHPWVEEEVVDKKKRQRRRTTQICTFNFKRFVARKRWKMAYNKIRAMNLIAKMGIRPPPGFITEIPPMVEKNGESPSPEPQPVEEKPAPHKDHKKKESTIHRKKHKHPSSSKTPVEKTDSLTLKTMDIDIGEGQKGEPEPEPVDENEPPEEVAPSPMVEEPVNTGPLTKREKRRLRGQLRTDEIAKSKKVIDAKQVERPPDDAVNGSETAENAPAMDVDETPPPADEKPAETVTSTMQIDHKPAAKTPSGGVLKKSKATRIPSTEDHYFVTLNAALLQQDDAFYYSGLQPTRQHGILKHSGETKKNVSEVKMTPSENLPQVFNDVPKDSESVPKDSNGLLKGAEEPPKPVANRKVSEFTTVVEVLSGGGRPPSSDYPGQGGMVVGLQLDKTVAHSSEKVTGTDKKADVPKTESKPAQPDSDPKRKPSGKEGTAPPLKKPLAKTDNTLQTRDFTPPPWQRKSSRENLKPSSQPVYGVSKISLNRNRFVSDDKQPASKSPTNAPATPKSSNVLGKSKLFEKEANQPEPKKAATTKSEPELKNLACEINLDDSPEKNSESKPRSNSQARVRSDSKPKVLSDNESKSRSNSQLKAQSKTRPDNAKNEENKESKFTANASRSRSGSQRKDDGITKVSNGENAKKSKNNTPRSTEEVSPSTTVQVSAGNEEAERETGKEVKEQLSGSATRSLTEVTVMPRANSDEEKTGGFDIMLTVAPPPTDEPSQEPRAVSSMKTRFTSTSSSSLPDPRSGLANGKLTSLSTNDMTSLSTRYTPQKRDFSKYLQNESSKSIKTTGVPTNTKAPGWQLKRNNPPNTTTTPPKITVTPKSPSTATTVSVSPAVKSATAKVHMSIPKGKKTAVNSTVYIPTRSFGFTTMTGNQTELTAKPSEPDDSTKLNNNDESKRWSQSSYTSDRSGSSASSDDVVAENNEINRTNSNEKISIKDPEISRQIENHSEKSSPVTQRKWKAKLVLPEESKKVPSAQDRDTRISSTNAPRKNKFSNVRSMWEGK